MLDLAYAISIEQYRLDVNPNFYLVRLPGALGIEMKILFALFLRAKRLQRKARPNAQKPISILMPRLVTPPTS